jgi:hypothetical protein
VSKRFGKAKAPGRTRHIPLAERKKVEGASAFVCAWCGVALTEYHHIHEFAEGGPSTAENLILLCPTCHSEVTSGKITSAEIAQRRSELAGHVTRGSGNLAVPAGKLTFGMGNVGLLNGERFLVVNDETARVSVRVKGTRLLVSLQYFDADGRLVAWMSDNRWWVETESGYRFIFSPEGLLVGKKGAPRAFQVTIDSGHVEITGTFWIRGVPIEFAPTGVTVPTGLQTGAYSFDMINAPSTPAFRFVIAPGWGLRGYTCIYVGFILYPFGLKFVGNRWMGIRLLIDPISGKRLDAS